MIGKSIANRPYMYLPLKGDTNDYSINAQNPSNTGVTTTTGQFGESNGAYEWDADADNLSWASGVGNSIASKINNGCTVTLFANFTQKGAVFNQRGNNPQGSFNLPIIASGENLVVNMLTDGSTGSTMLDYASFNANYSSWGFLAIQVVENGSNLDGEMYWNMTSLDTGTSTKANESSTATLRIGQYHNGNASALMSMHTFRFYDVTLSNGALKILNTEKGRIRA